MRALAVEIHEDWIEQHRYLNMELLREHKKLKLEQITFKSSYYFVVVDASRIRERVMIKDKGSSEYRGTLFYKKMMMRHLIPSSLFLVNLPYPLFSVWQSWQSPRIQIVPATPGFFRLRQIT